MPREMTDLTQAVNTGDKGTKQYFTTPEFAELVGFHEQTLRYWDRSGRFKPHHRTPGGTRMYALEQVKELQEIFAADGLFNDPDERRLKSKRAKFNNKTKKNTEKQNIQVNQNDTLNPDEA